MAAKPPLAHPTAHTSGSLCFRARAASSRGHVRLLQLALLSQAQVDMAMQCVSKPQFPFPGDSELSWAGCGEECRRRENRKAPKGTEGGASTCRTVRSAWEWAGCTLSGGRDGAGRVKVGGGLGGSPRVFTATMLGRARKATAGQRHHPPGLRLSRSTGKPEQDLTAAGPGAALACGSLGSEGSNCSPRMLNSHPM